MEDFSLNTLNSVNFAVIIFKNNFINFHSAFFKSSLFQVFFLHIFSSVLLKNYFRLPFTSTIGVFLAEWLKRLTEKLPEWVRQLVLICVLFYLKSYFCYRLFSLLYNFISGNNISWYLGLNSVNLLLWNYSSITWSVLLNLLLVKFIVLLIENSLALCYLEYSISYSVCFTLEFNASFKN